MNLNPEDQELLDAIKTQLTIVADVSRADVLLYGPLLNETSTILAHSHPHTVAPAHLKNLTGTHISITEKSPVIKTLKTGSPYRKQTGQTSKPDNTVNVVSLIYPVVSPLKTGRIIGALSIEASLLEHERQRRRDRAFQKAVTQLQIMLTQGRISNAHALSTIGEPEGFVVVDKDGIIRYTSGVAANLYRRLGYLDSLIGRRLETLATQDDQLFQHAVTRLECVERETESGGRHWIRKAIPLRGCPGYKDLVLTIMRRLPTPQQSVGALLVLKDITAERRTEQAMRVKNAMIQEIHHRVKNNLQTIAALLRIQSRRITDKPATAALNDAINRILSVAVIHEFLSDQQAWSINLKDVCQRIISQTRQSIMLSADRITFSIDGPAIWLPARQATACALVINELLQNSLEHGFENQPSGTIAITLIDNGDQVAININDNGRGLPENFDLSNPGSLGLQIAGTLVNEDLQGALTLTNNQGTLAAITFPKDIFQGEQGWNENES